jgi:hypothetical protein
LFGCDKKTTVPNRLNVYATSSFALLAHSIINMAFPGMMGGMGAMNGMNGGGADLEAMKQQQAIKYVRQQHHNSSQYSPQANIALRCKQPWNPAPASSPCPA